MHCGFGHSIGVRLLESVSPALIRWGKRAVNRRGRALHRVRGLRSELFDQRTDHAINEHIIQHVAKGGAACQPRWATGDPVVAAARRQHPPDDLGRSGQRTTRFSPRAVAAPTATPEVGQADRSASQVARLPLVDPIGIAEEAK